MKHIPLTLLLLLPTTLHAEHPSAASYATFDHQEMLRAIEQIEANHQITPSPRRWRANNTLHMMPDLVRQSWEAALDREIATRKQEHGK